MSELTIREMEQGEEFADWFADLTQREEEATGVPAFLEEHYLILSNEIGDWIGGLRYGLRGGVAQVLDIAVRESERHRGHGHRLLSVFEERARELGALSIDNAMTEDSDAIQILSIKQALMDINIGITSQARLHRRVVGLIHAADQNRCRLENQGDVAL